MSAGRDWYYGVYLKSPHWWNTEQRMLELAGHCCEFCGASGNPETDPDEQLELMPLSVHHLNYDHIWAERNEDLAVLCRHCHVDAHKFPKRLDEISRYIAHRRTIQAPAEEIAE